MEASPNNTGIDAPQSARQRARRRLGSEEGVTLVDLTAIALLTTLLAIAMPTVVQGLRTEPKISERAAQIAKARALVERVARELRQGYAVDSACVGAHLPYLHAPRQLQRGAPSRGRGRGPLPAATAAPPEPAPGPRRCPTETAAAGPPSSWTD